MQEKIKNNGGAIEGIATGTSKFAKRVAANLRTARTKAEGDADTAPNSDGTSTQGEAEKKTEQGHHAKSPRKAENQPQSIPQKARLTPKHTQAFW